MANNVKSKETGVVYDMHMTQHRSLWDPKHPEKPERLTSILDRSETLGLLKRCIFIPPRLATTPEIMSLHTSQHVWKLKEICNDLEDVARSEELASTYEAVYFHPSTYELALLAAGSTIDLVQSVVKGNIRNGMAIVRPPGHHAMKEEYCGFCYFNNVAIAAKNVLDTTPTQRILIVDFDVHHGQGTQQLFYDDPRVLYFSTHRYEHGKYWPSLEESNFNWIGNGQGIGFNCNVPLNKAGLGNSDFLTIWHKILIPLAYQFSPELVIVSAGFDAALGCPEGQMRVTPQCYPHLVHPLMGLANGKVAVVLEGGYCLKSLAEAAALSLRTLLGDPCPLIPPIAVPNPVVAETVLDLTGMMKGFWGLGPTEFLDGPAFEDSITSGQAHKPRVYFERQKPKPLKFPTREFYGAAFQKEETFKALDQELDKLISESCLTVPTHRLACGFWKEEAFKAQPDFLLDRICRIKCSSDDPTDTIMPVLENVLNGSCQCGVAVTNEARSSSCATCMAILSTPSRPLLRSLRRILIIDLEVDGPKTLNQNENVLYVSFTHSVPGDSDVGLDKLNVIISLDSNEDDSVFMAFTNILLPIAYEYGPELVLIAGASKDSAGRSPTAELQAHMIHILSSLANGKIVLILKGNSNFLWNLASFKALLGDPLTPMRFFHKNPANESVRASIRKLIQAYSKYWEVLRPFDKVLPSTISVQPGNYNEGI